MNILVAVDFSEATGVVLKAAAQQAQALTAHLWLIYVAEAQPDFVGYEAGPPTVREELAVHLRQRHQELQQRAEELRRSGIQVTALMEQGPTAVTLLHQAERLKADLLIVGSHGRGAMLHLLLGSVSEQVLKKATCPVLVVPIRKPA
jgi:nucleotide-binding universal stress UspA family protein